MTALIIPLLLIAVGAWAVYKKTDPFSAMTAGAGSGIKTVFNIMPGLCVLLPAVYMLRASGLPESLAGWLSPVFGALGLPPETAALMLLRPVSGSGALAIGAEIMEQYGPDSLIGRTAAVMLGSTETTFYVIAIYFGAAGLKRNGRAIGAALVGDVVGFIAAAWSVRIFM